MLQARPSCRTAARASEAVARCFGTCCRARPFCMTAAMASSSVIKRLGTNNRARPFCWTAARAISAVTGGRLRLPRITYRV